MSASLYVKESMQFTNRSLFTPEYISRSADKPNLCLPKHIMNSAQLWQGLKGGVFTHDLSPLLLCFFNRSALSVLQQKMVKMKNGNSPEVLAEPGLKYRIWVTWNPSIPQSFFLILLSCKLKTCSLKKKKSQRIWGDPHLLPHKSSSERAQMSQ